MLLLGRSEEERARLEVELRDARGATAGAALVAQQLPVRAPLVWQLHSTSLVAVDLLSAGAKQLPLCAQDATSSAALIRECEVEVRRGLQ